ncbi:MULTISPECIES: bifunctional 2-polyprenyl-6-hydroxyphenol methylase/3-demethylubiquinol 3-O-methyltransferase UbiG [unclassified Bacillus (in: firmicutes)]|uniref:class I SAM-dependent methyltransferase n=1 Tax=unclassified Bacillus (in: firmicutes) TaxID=185979 RepID=UPI0008E0162A|nr:MULTISPECIES: class I SAM-dependent methyltransferase [unclassified Bacillus (in: firmicutes)]SFA91523.1 Methyltransferase domain-containing protein [Bacillus sp. UNCCL13]SFQ85591.1 Methyltransferase domain-containing protein [Bacillus sp. cl95]
MCDTAAALETRPYSHHDFEKTELTPSYRVDLRNPTSNGLDQFINAKLVYDWSQLTWKDIGKPYEVKSVAKSKKEWEQTNGEMSVKTSWEFFNRSFHEWFVMDVPAKTIETKQRMKKHLSQFHFKEVKEALGETMRLSLWNYAHRIEDGVWDPRGKRALFQGLDVEKPRILFLGAAEGYEAMQLSAMYPGGEVVMVDYDEFCKTDRFGDFPESYPFLGVSRASGSPTVWYKDQMNIHYVVDDIRNLSFGKEFDIVISVGLLEHFPDEYKHEVMDWHRRFLKEGGYVIMTTPRHQLKSRLFYSIMADVMNHTYRELMDIRQMGLYVYEGGFEILRHGFIKVHNGIVARPR